MAETAAVKTAIQPEKAPERRSLFEEFERAYDAVARRAFEIFESSGRSVGHDLEHWFKAESELIHPLRVNLSESESAFAIQAEVPGFTTKDLRAEIEGQKLVVSGKRETNAEQKKGKQIYREHSSNEILRIIELPGPVDAAKATASLKNGMLELQIPKSNAGKGSRAEVNIA